MKQATMKTPKGDVPLILLSAIGGFLLVFFSLAGRTWAWWCSSALCLACPPGLAAAPWRAFFGDTSQRHD